MLSLRQLAGRNLLVASYVQILVKQPFVALLDVDATATLAACRLVETVTAVPASASTSAPRSMHRGAVTFAGVTNGIMGGVKRTLLHRTPTCPMRFAFKLGRLSMT